MDCSDHAPYRIKRWLFLLLLLTILAPNGTAQNLVLNGGFETGNFNNWTQVGNTGFTAVLSATTDPAAPSPEGTRHARFGPLAPGGIFQDFATTVGTAYRVSYFLNFGTSSASTRSFLAQAGNPASLTNFDLLTNPSLPVLTATYVQRFFTFTATTTTSRIQFVFENDPDWWRLDNVFVTRAVPEIDPSSSRLPVLILLGGLLLVWERRRQTVAL